MPMMRRRPLARAAIVGGVAYSAGKRREAGQQQDAETQARLDDLEAQAYAAPPPAAPAAAPAPAAGGMTDDTIQQLKDLAALHEQGVLTDEEFTAQKQKILGG
jgi:putative oligomerization/nucleic acid binding protein